MAGCLRAHVGSGAGGHGHWPLAAAPGTWYPLPAWDLPAALLDWTGPPAWPSDRASMILLVCWAPARLQGVEDAAAAGTEQSILWERKLTFSLSCLTVRACHV